MPNNKNVIFNCIAKDVENAKEIVQVAGNRVLIGIMVKSFPDTQSAVDEVTLYQEQNIPVSVGLGAGDPAVWKQVADVSAATLPKHINQVFPASAYTLGRLEEAGAANTIINALVKPSGIPGQVIIATGPDSSRFEETVSADLAAVMLAEMGVDSVKFYPIEGDKRLEEVAAMAKAAADAGIKYFEPTGGITVENVDVIVKTCLESGAETVIPHLYTSLVDRDTGETKIEYMKKLIAMEW
ncbi:KDGP aldolase [Bacillus massiliglaciei]|uniref:KDGP aldolase n=1 Tax=Bacillus massiliglaciei TaxID=1816693 RepID=UPI000A80EAEF|nr:KDGP aldolase [Bacillus massiliglaciei]